MTAHYVRLAIFPLVSEYASTKPINVALLRHFGKMFIKFLHEIISVIVRNLRLFYVLISCHVNSSIFSNFFSKENLNFLLCHLKNVPLTMGRLS